MQISNSFDYPANYTHKLAAGVNSMAPQMTKIWKHLQIQPSIPFHNITVQLNKQCI